MTVTGTRLHLEERRREIDHPKRALEQKLPFVRRVASHFHIMSKGAVVASDAMSGLTEALVKEHLSV